MGPGKLFRRQRKTDRGPQRWPIVSAAIINHEGFVTFRRRDNGGRNKGALSSVRGTKLCAYACTVNGWRRIALVVILCTTQGREREREKGRSFINARARGALGEDFFFVCLGCARVGRSARAFESRAIVSSSLSRPAIAQSPTRSPPSFITLSVCRTHAPPPQWPVEWSRAGWGEIHFYTAVVLCGARVTPYSLRPPRTARGGNEIVRCSHPPCTVVLPATEWRGRAEASDCYRTAHSPGERGRVSRVPSSRPFCQLRATTTSWTRARAHRRRRTRFFDDFLASVPLSRQHAHEFTWHRTVWENGARFVFQSNANSAYIKNKKKKKSNF